MVPDERPARRAPERDLDARYREIVSTLRRDLHALRGRIDRFGRAYARSAGRGGADEATQAALRRLKQLQLVADQIESSAAYLDSGGAAAGSVAPADGAQRVLESLEAERERTSRDVHDGPAQALANAIFELEYLERIVDRTVDHGTVQAEIKKLKGQLRSSLESVRAMIFDLRPPTLAELGLASAMRSYAADFAARSGVSVEVSATDGETGLLPQQELAVFRVMQEALQNVRKHAQANTVRLDWAREGGRWRLCITDDGIGFDPVKASQRKRSVGLLSMRERASLIGGTLEVRPADDGGTTVALVLPVRKDDRA